MTRSIALSLALLTVSACSQGGDQTGSENDASASAVPDVPSAKADPVPQATSSPVATTPNDDEEKAERAPLQPDIPIRFHGKYAQTADQCGSPNHGLFTVGAKQIRFFESSGEVRNVRADGPYAAATVFEEHADGVGSTYVFYMRLMPDGALRHRYDDHERMTWVRCP